MSDKCIGKRLMVNENFHNQLLPSYFMHQNNGHNSSLFYLKDAKDLIYHFNIENLSTICTRILLLEDASFSS